MYQTQYFNQTGACNLRKLLSFSSYTEGWATYVEYYAYRLDNGLAPGLGELLAHNSSFTLALYALLDINIHYEGWDLKQMGSFLNQFFSISDEEVISTIYYDIAENPGQLSGILHRLPGNLQHGKRGKRIPEGFLLASELSYLSSGYGAGAF